MLVYFFIEEEVILSYENVVEKECKFFSINH